MNTNVAKEKHLRKNKKHKPKKIYGNQTGHFTAFEVIESSSRISFLYRWSIT